MLLIMSVEVTPMRRTIMLVNEYAAACIICVEKEKALFTFTNFSCGVKRGITAYSRGALRPLHNEMKITKVKRAEMFVDSIGNNIINNIKRAVLIHCRVYSNE